ncbi:hypothetical protein SESBI_38758 [Sesbania bispinosa]|nr:hypothetical protein SESBI_38758 [Sesbania bispinosa]
MNLAHLSMQAWRLLKNHESIWGKVLKSIYFPNQEFLDAKKGRQPSWMWASIMEGRDFLLRHRRWIVASDSKIKIGKHSWVAAGDNLSEYLTQEDTFVATLMEENTLKDGKTPNNPHLTYLSFLLWNIWKHHNNAVFREKGIQPLEVIQQTNLQVDDWSNVTTIKTFPSTQRTTQYTYQWRPPRGDILKFNTDASWSTHGNLAALGIAVRDSKGYLVSGLSKKSPAPSPDNLLLIRACREEIQIGEIDPIVRDILSLKASFQLCGFLWTDWRGNEVAHLIAKSTINGTLPSNWTINPPPPLLALIQQEAAQACSSSFPRVENR